MYKIFYNPTSLKIMGMSDGDDSLQFPFIETDEYYHSLENLYLEEVDGVVSIKFKKQS